MPPAAGLPPGPRRWPLVSRCSCPPLAAPAGAVARPSSPADSRPEHPRETSTGARDRDPDPAAAAGAPGARAQGRKTRPSVSRRVARPGPGRSLSGLGPGSHWHGDQGPRGPCPCPPGPICRPLAGKQGPGASTRLGATGTGGRQDLTVLNFEGTMAVQGSTGSGIRATVAHRLRRGYCLRLWLRGRKHTRSRCRAWINPNGQ
jgi:hypothetical protein